MALLRIRLFGAVRVSHADHPREERLSHAVQALLAWLVLNRRKTHAREALAGVFWGEQQEDRARSCLSTALWRLKQALEPDGVPRGAYLISDPTAVGFNCDSEHWLDVAAFEEGARLLRTLDPRGDAPADWSRAEVALGHCTGDLLEGFYDDWAIRERERLRLLHLDSLGILLSHYAGTGATDEALRCGLRILAIDPLREDTHREIIRLHLRRGHRALALRQYEWCRTVLEDELGVEPLEETRALCAGVHPASRSAAGRAVTGRTATPVANSVVTSLRAAAVTLGEARRAILEVLRLAESESDPS